MKPLTSMILIAVAALGAQGSIINVPGDVPTVQQGLGEAVNGDTVLIAEGHYYERLSFLGKNVLLASEFIFTGDPTSVENTILDGDTSVLGRIGNACVILMNNGEGPDAIVEGFTIQNGEGFLNDYGRRLGGAIYCEGASPTIKNNVFTQNSAVHCGGAICCSAGSDATITNNFFTGNRANYGGAILCSESSPVINKNEMTGNSAEGDEVRMGGAICNYKCDGQITQNYIHGNSATMGGGICLYVLDTDYIWQNEIVNNDALAIPDSGYGGGICCYHTYSGTIVDNLIAGNSARTGGGGLHFWLSNAVPGEDVVLADNIITGNHSNNFGGGASLESFVDASVFSGNLIADNTALGRGGGLAFVNSNLTSIDKNTVAYNDATSGGGFWATAGGGSSPPIPVTNTILYGNTGGGAPQILMEGIATFYVTYCDVEGDWPGSMNIDCDPQFCYPAQGNYEIAVSSCCYGAGQGGVTIGAYGIGCVSTGVDELPDAAERLLVLHQNTPNPFNPETEIAFTLAKRMNVSLTIYDIAGREIDRLIEGRTLDAGLHKLSWSARPGETGAQSSGVYFYRIDAGGFVETRKMILLK